MVHYVLHWLICETDNLNLIRNNVVLLLQKIINEMINRHSMTTLTLLAGSSGSPFSFCEKRERLQRYRRLTQLIFCTACAPFWPYSRQNASFSQTFLLKAKAIRFPATRHRGITENMRDYIIILIPPLWGLLCLVLLSFPLNPQVDFIQ